MDSAQQKNTLFCGTGSDNDTMKVAETLALSVGGEPTNTQGKQGTVPVTENPVHQPLQQQKSSTYFPIHCDLRAPSFTSLDEIKQRLGIPLKPRVPLVPPITPRIPSSIVGPFLTRSLIQPGNQGIFVTTWPSQAGSSSPSSPFLPMSTSSPAVMNDLPRKSVQYDSNSPNFLNLKVNVTSKEKGVPSESKLTTGSGLNSPSMSPLHARSDKAGISQGKETGKCSASVPVSSVQTAYAFEPGKGAGATTDARPRRLVPYLEVKSEVDGAVPASRDSPRQFSGGAISTSRDSPSQLPDKLGQSLLGMDVTAQQAAVSVTSKDLCEKLSSSYDRDNKDVSTLGTDAIDAVKDDANLTRVTQKEDATSFPNQDSILMETTELKSTKLFDPETPMDEVRTKLETPLDHPTPHDEGNLEPAVSQLGEDTDSRVDADSLKPCVPSEYILHPREELPPVVQKGKTDDGFDQAAVLRFRNNFIEAVEELRMRRNLDVENEVKIKQLLGEKHNLERKLLDEATKLTNLIAEHDRHVNRIRQESSNHVKGLEAGKAKFQTAAECSKRELGSLKDEIRSLQITKYSLEKHVAELNHRIHMYNTMKDSTYCQITECERSSKILEKKFEEVAEVQTRLEKNVKQSMELNKKLEFINKHHLCQIEEYKSDIAKLKQENIDLKVLIEIKPQDFDQRLAVKTHEIERLKQQLKKKEEESEKFVRQKEELKEEKQALIKSLDSSHQLVDQQVQCNEQNILDIQRLEGELTTLKDKYKILTEKYDAKAADYDQESSDHQVVLMEWKTQHDSLSSRLRSLQQDHEALMKAHGNLEDLNSSWAEKNMKLLEDIKALKEKYEKEMTNQSVQTEDNLTSAGTQTEEDVIGHIADLEETVVTKDKNIQSLRDKVDFFEEIAKGAGHLKEVIEELRDDVKVKEAEIIKLSKLESEVDQVTQTDGTITSDESAQTSQDFVTNDVVTSANTVDESNEGNVGSPVSPPVDNSDDEVAKVGADPPRTSSDTQIATEAGDIIAKEGCLGSSVEKLKTSNVDMNSAVKLLNETIEDSKKVFEHSAESQNTEKNSGRKLKSNLNENETIEDGKKVVVTDTKSQKVVTTTSETKSQKLGTESRVKYLASMIQLNLDEKDETFRSQELNEALHSRLRKKVALLKGETEKDSALKSLSVLSNKATRKSSPRNRFGLLDISGDSLMMVKPGGSSPKTGSLGPSHVASSISKSSLTTNSRIGARRPILVTTVTKSLTKPEAIYASAQQGLNVPSVMVSPSIVVGSKDNSAFSSIGQSTHSAASKVGSSIPMGTENPSSEHSALGKRKCIELGAGDAAGLNGKGAPLDGRDGEKGDVPKAGTSGILLDPLQSRQKFAKRVRFDSQTTEQSFDEHWKSIQTVFTDRDEGCDLALSASVVPCGGEDLLFSDDEEMLI